MFFDTHAHLTEDSMFEDIDGILNRAKEKGVTSIVNVCISKKALDRGLELSKKNDFVYTATATHPIDASTNESIIDVETIESLASLKKIVAVGETGLDYYHKSSSREDQKELLKRYFSLATKIDLPVIIHSRDSFDDIFRISDKYFKNGKAVLHCFTGTLEDAKRAVDRGWFISFSAIITFKNAMDLRKILREVPIDHILAETDSPYLAPQSVRGKRNEPSFLPETVKTIANVKGKTLSQVANELYKNSQNFFRIK